MAQAQAQHYYTPEEYLALEVQSQERHEYIAGEVVEVTGGTPNHNQITLNLSGGLNFALRRQPYRVFVADQRLWIPARQIYTYPNVMVIQGEVQLRPGRSDTVINPLLIAEVLSKSTRSYDKDEKFAAYRTIPSFQEYVLIDQYTMHVEQYARTEAGKWLFSESDGEHATLTLSSLAFELELAELYDKVDFAAEAAIAEDFIAEVDVNKD